MYGFSYSSMLNRYTPYVLIVIFITAYSPNNLQRIHLDSRESHFQAAGFKLEIAVPSCNYFEAIPGLYLIQNILHMGGKSNLVLMLS